MKLQDIIIGETYRFKDHPTTGYAKVIAILKPEEGVNPHPYSIIKCEQTIRTNDNIGFIRYFRPDSLQTK